MCGEIAIFNHQSGRVRPMPLEFLMLGFANLTQHRCKRLQFCSLQDIGRFNPVNGYNRVIRKAEALGMGFVFQFFMIFMLLNTYTKEIFRPDCNPQFQSLHCFAHLDEDIGEVLPYLNTVLGGTGYTQSPPSLMLQAHGRLIALHPKKIALNALKDEKEADQILEWLKREINETWKNRGKITPSFGVAPKPQLIEILKLLPKTNCRKCGHPTCTVFASLIVQGAKGFHDCPELSDRGRKRIDDYLSHFSLDDP